jgi:hypothetical protein
MPASCNSTHPSYFSWKRWRDAQTEEMLRLKRCLLSLVASGGALTTGLLRKHSWLSCLIWHREKTGQQWTAVWLSQTDLGLPDQGWWTVPIAAVIPHKQHSFMWDATWHSRHIKQNVWLIQTPPSWRQSHGLPASWTLEQTQIESWWPWGPGHLQCGISKVWVVKKKGWSRKCLVTWGTISLEVQRTV